VALERSTGLSLRELMANIKAERSRLMATLNRITGEEMLNPGVVGPWSVKDVLAHVAMWYSRAVTLLFQAERGKPLQLPRSNVPDWADVNAQDYQSQRDRPLDRVLADFDGAHRQLLKRLEAWRDEAALFDTRRYPALQGRSLAEVVWNYTGAHSAEHRAQIEAWLASRTNGARL
jgi:uncharacterized damage-inducible protein DinB